MGARQKETVETKSSPPTGGGGREESGGLHYYHNLIQERKSVACPADPVGVETQWRSFFYCAPNLPSRPVVLSRSFLSAPPRRPVRLLFATRHRQIILSAPLPTPISIHSIDRFGFSRRPGRLVAHCSSRGDRNYLLGNYRRVNVASSGVFNRTS